VTVNIKERDLNELLRVACESGANDAVIIPTGKIITDPFLADRCREPKCRNYGLSKSCPPHVSGSAAFIKQLEKFEQAIFCRVDVPSEIIDSADTLFSYESRAVFQLLHEIVAGIETAAVQMEFLNSQAYAGGSCKNIFCHNHPECHAISEKKECRHPEVARPSMSGFGIDVAKLFKTCGWKMRWEYPATDTSTMHMAAISGLVLIG
jgi:predicted metal-binding protein